MNDIISLITGLIFIAGFLAILEMLDRKQKLINKNYKNKIIKHK